MAFEFSSGPKSTSRSIAQIAQIIERTGNAKKFMGLARRLNTSSIGPGSFGAFAPSAADDPFASSRTPADWSVGWKWGNSVTNSWGMTLVQGWQVVFEVHSNNGSNSVSARAKGTTFRSDVERFITLVFNEL